MLVGAPKYRTAQPGLEKPAGGVFQCPMSSFIDDCEYLDLDSTGNDGE